MKRHQVLLISGLFLIGQNAISYQSILNDTSVHRQLQQVKAEKKYGKVKQDSENSSVKYVTYEYKKKKKELAHIEKHMTVLKKQMLGSGAKTRGTEVGKIAMALTGKFLIGTQTSKNEG